MGMPKEPLTLTPEQIARLNKQLSEMRHAVNNNLALMIAAAEVIRYKPERAAQVVGTFVEQSRQAADKIKEFSSFFEQTLHITRE